MTVVGWVASVVLGAVFLSSGALKVRNPTWPAQARALGAPGFAIPVVPWLELAIGALLVVRLLRPFVPIAALVLLALFTALIGWRLSKGQRPACSCFGNLSVRPIGPDTLVRNVVLMGVAGVATAW